MHLEGAPSKTFFVEANTHYQFNRWRSWITKIEFGGWCVDEGDCMSGQECRNGVCVPEGTPENGGQAPALELLKGTSGYCAEKIARGFGTCEIGKGGCSSNAECRADSNPEKPEWGTVVCRGVSGIDVNICCYANNTAETNSECTNFYNSFMAG